jgi:hypothetical protein
MYFDLLVAILETSPLFVALVRFSLGLVGVACEQVVLPLAAWQCWCAFLLLLMFPGCFAHQVKCYCLRLSPLAALVARALFRASCIACSASCGVFVVAKHLAPVMFQCSFAKTRGPAFDFSVISSRTSSYFGKFSDRVFGMTFCRRVVLKWRGCCGMVWVRRIRWHECRCRGTL